MDEKVMQFRVGVMFLATFLVTGILLVMFGKLPKYIGNYPIQIRFTQAGGLTVDAPVRKSGLLIGKVSKIQLTDDDAAVLVTADIQSDKTIYEDEVFSISRDLLGDTALVVARNLKSDKPHQPVPRDQVILGRVSNDPTGLVDALQSPINTVKNTGDALTIASDRLGSAASRVENILDPEAQKNIQSILHNMASAMKAIDEILGNEENRKNLAQSMKKLPDAIDNMSNTFEATNQTLQKFTTRGKDGKSPIERMVSTIDMTEKTLRKFSEPGPDGKPAPADQMARVIENVNEITSVVRSIMTRVDEGNGSIGALVNDRELYDRLCKTAKNLEDLTQKLKPILDDARVFSDKIARHPGVIARDAIKPQPGIK